MVSTKLIQIALSFVVAGLWISSATLAGERLGSRVAGLITNLPSNTLVALLFVALTRGVPYASAAAGSVSIGMAIDILYLVTFILTVPRGLPFALGVSFSMWCLVAWLAGFMPPPSLARGLLLYILVWAASMLFLERLLAIRSVPRREVAFKFGTLVARALFAGTVVAGAVTAAQFAPPFLTGILSCFPAVFTSSLVILTRSQGVAFARAAGKFMVFSSSTIIVYAAAIAVFFPRAGIWLGTLLGFAVATLYISLLVPLAKRLV